MSTALQTAEGYSPAQVALIREQLCKGGTEDELRLFLAVAQRTGLDPFRRQIYAVMRPCKQEDGSWGKRLSIEVAIDGWRLLLARSGEVRGVIGPQWCGPDGPWLDAWLAAEPPAAARYGVRLRRWEDPVWGVARFSSFCPTGKDGKPMGKWASMPEHMLALAAERQAIRRALPVMAESISDELDPSESLPAVPVPAPAPTPTPILTWAERKQRAIQAISSEAIRLRLDPAEVLDRIGTIDDSASDLVRTAWADQARALYSELRAESQPEEV